MNDLIFKIIEIVLYVLVAAMFRYLIPFLTTQLRQSKYAFLADLINDAVYATEQSVQGEAMGDKRRAIVYNYAMKSCQKYNIPFSGEQINMLIEAAVKAMNDEKVPTNE